MKKTKKTPPTPKPSPKPETLKIAGDWQEAMGKAVNKKRPAQGWPQMDRSQKDRAACRRQILKICTKKGWTLEQLQSNLSDRFSISKAMQIQLRRMIAEDSNE